MTRRARPPAPNWRRTPPPPDALRLGSWDDDLCLECELRHPCQVHDRQPPPTSDEPARSGRGWLRRLISRPHFRPPTRPGDPR